jgi:GWxTD domain-containing protein
LKKIFLVIAFAISFNAYSQKLNQDFFTDIYSVPSSDSAYQFFYLYKIPVKSLIFSKDNDSYTASIQIAIEVSDSNSNSIQRHFNDRKITFDEFSLTSDPNTYIEGVIPFLYRNEKLIVTSNLFDANSQKDIFTKEQTIQKVKNEQSDFLNPIILNDNVFKCVENDSRVLPNFGGFIPFDNNSYDILIPSTDTVLEELFVKIISGRDTVFNGVVQRRDTSRIGFADCNGRIIISQDSLSKRSSNFYLTHLTQKLKEGQFEIIVSKSENFQKAKSFRPIVRWLNKPKSLTDPESAIRLLRFIIQDDSVKQMLKSSDNYDSLLHLFWKKRDPSPSTEYNELMTEYYERIDFSFKQFSTISNLSGLETDRGKIYILYGKPTSIERGSNGDGKILETWTYSKLQKRFIFVDEKGTGEFILKSTL